MADPTTVFIMIRTLLNTPWNIKGYASDLAA
jgi:hypothetical protein